MKKSHQLPAVLLRIRIGFNADPDSDPRFDDQKLTKLKIFFKYFFDQKLQSYAFIKDVQAAEEVFIPQKKTSTTSKLEFSSLLWVILALLDPDPYS
jgi:hypothetical protein